MDHLLDYPGFLDMYETSTRRMYGTDEDNNALKEHNRIGSLGRMVTGRDHERNLICIDGNYLIPMSSCDYLGLSQHPKVMEAAVLAMKKYGTGATGVRTLTGNINLYYELEREIAILKNAKYAFIGTSGYAINSYLIPQFFDKNYYIVHDFFVHASMYYGVRTSESLSKGFRHNDMKSLAAILENRPEGMTPIIMVEGIYSMQGTLTPLPELIKLKEKYKCKIWLDEAHSIGVLGADGSGIHTYFELGSEQVNFWIGTFSKSIPGIGGYIVSSEVNLYELLMGSAQYNIFSSALPPHCLAIALESIRIMKTEGLCSILRSNIQYFKRLMSEAGFETRSHPDSSIYLLEIGSVHRARKFTDRLREEGIFCHEIIYPALPRNKSAIRLTITASHSMEQLLYCVNKLSMIYDNFKIKNEHK